MSSQRLPLFLVAGLLCSYLISRSRTSAKANKDASKTQQTAKTPYHYTDGIVILGFLRETSPPFQMNQTRAEKRAHNYCLVGPTEALQLRIAKGAELYHQLQANGPRKAVIIVSGGDPQELNSSEAELMEQELVKLGVKKQDIIREVKARHTIENGVFCCRILGNSTVYPQLSQVHLVTNLFHGNRSLNIFEAFLPAHLSLRPDLATNGDFKTLHAQTGRSFEEWVTAEKKQLQFQRENRPDHMKVGNILGHNIRGYLSLNHAISTRNMYGIQTILANLPQIGADEPVPQFLKRHQGLVESLFGRGGSGPLHYACLMAPDERIICMLLASAHPLIKATYTLNHNHCSPLHFLPFSPCFLNKQYQTCQRIRELFLKLESEIPPEEKDSEDSGGLGGKQTARRRRTEISRASGVSGLWEQALTASEIWAKQIQAQDQPDFGSNETASEQKTQDVVPAPVPIMQRCISAKAFNNSEYAVLHEAAKVGDVEGLEAWLVAHPESPVDSPEEGSTALFYACSSGDLNSVLFLLKHSADVNRTNHGGSTPLHYAIWHQHLDILNVLLAVGCQTLGQKGDGRPWGNKAYTPRELALIQLEAASERSRNQIQTCGTNQRSKQEEKVRPQQSEPKDSHKHESDLEVKLALEILIRLNKHTL